MLISVAILNKGEDLIQYIINHHNQDMDDKEAKFHQFKEYLKLPRDFPGGAVVQNPPANAGDTGSIPGPGRSHMPQSD